MENSVDASPKSDKVAWGRNPDESGKIARVLKGEKSPKNIQRKRYEGDKRKSHHKAHKGQNNSHHIEQSYHYHNRFMRSEKQLQESSIKSDSLEELIWKNSPIHRVLKGVKSNKDYINGSKAKVSNKKKQMRGQSYSYHERRLHISHVFANENNKNK
eukprot:CAMPEP_0172432440 /NCGR_PEP_ID=MMETSP1064-20121228/63358_1 /TAXON_ID=202472 /ORGANISM="Aulacoseira subarctica , Strain CCAP 1002/5" /LENGTH=156 /DNA_ID=CAMNT_0013179747 /DNA_START=402 /DNA_END=872 /DNA_ORIENTATION=-